jgi:hypothetical protein
LQIMDQLCGLAKTIFIAKFDVFWEHRIVACLQPTPCMSKSGKMTPGYFFLVKRCRMVLFCRMHYMTPCHLKESQVNGRKQASTHSHVPL